MSACVPECRVPWRASGKHCWRCPNHTKRKYSCHRCGESGHWVEECHLEMPNAAGVAASRAVKKKKKRLVKEEREDEDDGGVRFECPVERVPGVRALMRALGIAQMHQWQREILASWDVWGGRNLVFTAPTSAGKSFVSDVLMLNALTTRGGLALVVLPFVAMCEERYKSLRATCALFGVDVVRMWSGYGALKSKYTKPTAFVCTPERASELATQTHDHSNDVCFASVDELHHVQDKHRGPTMEILLTKLRTRRRLQIVGMSATLRGVETLAEWLDDARLFRTDFRPMPIDARFVVDGKLIDSRNPTVCYGECESVADLCKTKDQNVIVFCGSRAKTETMCRHLRESLGEQDAVAYHHAGLDATHRCGVLNAFRERRIRVLCATSTVAAGVNLPVDRVVVHELEMGFNAPDAGLKLQQMMGRAGRSGFSSSASAIVFLRSMDEFETVASLAFGPAGTLTSAVTADAWRRFVLEASAVGIIRTRDDVSVFAQSTLHAKLTETTTADALDAFDWCARNGFVDAETCAATRLGVAACGSTIELGTYLSAMDALKTATEEGLIMSTPLQILYYLVPETERPEVKGVGGADLWSDAPRRRVAERLGIEDRGPIEYRKIGEKRKYLRFVHALALERIIDETPIVDVSRALGVDPRAVVSLREYVSRFARGLAKCCEATPCLRQISTLVERLAERVALGAREELLPLTSVPEIDAVWARYFFNAGLKTPKSIACHGDVDTIVNRVREANGTMVKYTELRLRAQLALDACKEI